MEYHSVPVAKINDKLVLFVHVPKTGGSSVVSHLSSLGELSLYGQIGRPDLPCSPRHFHAKLLEGFFAEDFFDWTFMIVRHPVERLLSQYHYQTRKPNLLRNNLPFSLWLRYVFMRCRANPYYRNNHYRPQHEFEMPHTHVFRLEDGLTEPLNCLARVAELQEIKEPPWENKSQLRQIEISSSDREVIYKTYEEDYRRYGYEM